MIIFCSEITVHRLFGRKSSNYYAIIKRNYQKINGGRARVARGSAR